MVEAEERGQGLPAQALVQAPVQAPVQAQRVLLHRSRLHHRSRRRQSRPQRDRVARQRLAAAAAVAVVEQASPALVQRDCPAAAVQVLPRMGWQRAASFPPSPQEAFQTHPHFQQRGLMVAAQGLGLEREVGREASPS